jgi:hypothetical protein
MARGISRKRGRIKGFEEEKENQVMKSDIVLHLHILLSFTQ